MYIRPPPVQQVSQRKLPQLSDQSPQLQMLMKQGEQMLMKHGEKVRSGFTPKPVMYLTTSEDTKEPEQWTLFADVNDLVYLSKPDDLAKMTPDAYNDRINSNSYSSSLSLLLTLPHSHSSSLFLTQGRCRHSSDLCV